MSGIGPDPGPGVFLEQHLRRLHALALPLRDTSSRAAADALRRALRLHASIEERICFPSILSARIPFAGEVVAAARTSRGALLEALDGSRGPDVAARLDAYASFEEHRLLPLFAALPGVTLREMALEIQELLGSRGRARGA